MDLTHHFTVPASVEDVRTVFARPERLAHCFPGATITSANGDDFTGSVKVKLGPLALVYEGSGRYVKRGAHSGRVEMEFHGIDKRGHGTASLTVTAAFTANGDTTEVQAQTDLTLTGKPEQFGAAVVSDVSDKLVDQFADCLATRFADGSINATEPGTADVEPGSTEATELDPRVVTEGPVTTDLIDVGEVPDDAANGPQLGPSEPTVREPAPSPPPVRPAPTPPSGDRPQVWVPASNYSESDLEVLSRVLPPLLKRYWPFLGGAGVAAFVASKIIARQRKRR